jgi:hypothetical protein
LYAVTVQNGAAGRVKPFSELERSRKALEGPGPDKLRPFSVGLGMESDFSLAEYFSRGAFGLWGLAVIFQDVVPFSAISKSAVAGGVRKCKSVVTIRKARTYRAVFCTAQ